MNQSHTERGPFASIAKDLPAGLVVFLVALPLCLGVALASDAPLSSGIIAGIIGGIVVGGFSGSHTSVAGPAAGLTAVVASQIASLGSFQAFLTAVMLAGGLQVALGVFKAGVIKDFIPTSVIKGLLAAIGLILILKELPHLVGHDADPTGEMSFHQPDGETTFSELAVGLGRFHLGATVIGVTSIALMVLWGKVRFLKRSLVPGALVVVLVGVALNELFGTAQSSLYVSTEHLVQVPVADGLSAVSQLVMFPDLSMLTNPAIVPAAITLALVASLETLLNLEAVDKLDRQKRVSPPNRELVAQGLGNITAGLVGGLPVTSVIVRSSVNIDAGARSKLSTLFHGCLLFVAVVFLPHWLNRIPLAALAAILIMTGLKLASPQLFRQMWRQGREMFLPFAVTVGTILLTDLLIGVLVGLGVSAAFVLWSNQRRPIRRIVEHRATGEVLRVDLPNQVSFLNRLALSNLLNELPADGHVLLDATNTDYVDPDIIAVIQEFQRDVAPVRGITVSTKGLKAHYQQAEDKVLFVDYTTRELQEQCKPAHVVGLLAAGNDRFCAGTSIIRDLRQLRNATAKRQHPLAAVVAGSSSRTPVELVFDVGLGDISCIRTTATWVGDGVVTSLEYAVLVDHVKLIVLMGHTRNEAVSRALELADDDATQTVHLKRLMEGVRGTADASAVERWQRADVHEREQIVDAVARQHLENAAHVILSESAALALEVQSGRVGLVGCMYDVSTGKAEFFDVGAGESVVQEASSLAVPDSWASRSAVDTDSTDSSPPPIGATNRP